MDKVSIDGKSMKKNQQKILGSEFYCGCMNE